MENDNKIETEAEIKEWLSEHSLRYSNITDISLNKGRVDITGNVGINDSNIPFNICTVNGNFTIDTLTGEGNSKLTNIPNINIVNDGNKSAIFNISSCKSLTSR